MAVNFKIKWYGEEVKIKVRGNIAKRMRAVLIEIVNHIKQGMSVAYQGPKGGKRKKSYSTRWGEAVGRALKASKD